MKRLKLSIVALLSGLALSACGIFHHTPIVGTVTSKTHLASYQWTYLMPMYTTTCYGKPPTCTRQFAYFLPIVETEPEQWELIVQTDTGKFRTAHVAESTYDATNPGDHF